MILELRPRLPPLWFWQEGAIQYEMAMSKRELFDVAAEVRGETDKAWRLFDGTKTEWVPKSQVEKNSDGTFTMPIWLAKDKGFI